MQYLGKYKAASIQWAFNKSNQIDAKLRLVAEACMAAAESDVLVNGIVDQEYRTAVTGPFVRSYRMPGASNQQITLTDYRGRAIAGVMQDYANSEWLDTVMRGDTVIRVDKEHLFVATPVHYFRKPEAIFVVKFTLSDFLNPIIQNDAVALVEIEYQDTPLLFASATESFLNVPRERCILATWPCQNLPGLGVTVREPKERALAATYAMRNALLGIAGVVIAGFLVGVWYVSMQVSRPVNRLLRQMQRIQATGDLGLRVEPSGSREFVELSDRLNAMLGSLEDKTISLDCYQSSQEQLELAITGGNIGLWDWSPATGTVDYSNILKAQLGYSDEDEWNSFEDWHSRLHPDDREHCMRLVEDYLLGRSGEYSSTFRLRCKDASYRWISARGRAEFGSDGQPTRMIGVHLDIDERIRNEQKLKRLNEAMAQRSQELQATNRLLTQSNGELEQFAYVASHDLQEPLRKVAAFCELLNDEYGDRLEGEGKEYLQSIVRGAERMKTLIRDLLAFSRVKSQEAAPELVSSEKALDAALENLSGAIEQSHAQITAGSLPDVWFNERHLTQLFQNLIGNGIKYQQDSKPMIHIDTVREKENWVFSVQDNGIGISKEFHEQIFGVFKRLHNRRAYSGTGIGLAICKRLMERWGGEIWLESEEGQGTTFYFSIPTSPPQDAQTAGGVAIGNETSPASDLATLPS